MQLENQLPNLKKEYDKIESDGNQKEKLTLKIVKTSDGTQTIEQKTPKIYQERDKHILYRVLSRNEDGYESSDQSRVKTIILKRNIQVDSDREKSKKPDIENSETSENNLNLQGQNNSVVRRKSLRDELKQKKSIRSVNSRSVTPDTQLKKKTKMLDINEENELLEELPERSTKRLKKSSLEMPLNVYPNNQKVPSGTHEIHSLRESSTSLFKLKPYSHSFHRSKSVDKESLKPDNIVRRLSVSSTIHSSTSEPSIAKMNYFKSRVQSSRSISQSRSSTPLREKSLNQLINLTDANLNLNIKDEPLSDEEIVQREQVTVDDIPELVSEGNNKRKTILISTSDNSNDSFPPSSRARKSFPNSLVMAHRSADANQGPPIRNSNAMVCIPHVFPINVINSELPHTTINNQLQEANVFCDIERETTTSLPHTLNTHSVDLPSLIPKPSGVFTSEGNTFYQESGAVATLFSENAHRMTDYFKSLLIDTISAISSGVSDAQNVILKLELEKTKQQLNNLKNENQLKIEKLKKDHVDEIKIIRMSYGMYDLN